MVNQPQLRSLRASPSSHLLVFVSSSPELLPPPPYPFPSFCLTPYNLITNLNEPLQLPHRTPALNTPSRNPHALFPPPARRARFTDPLAWYHRLPIRGRGPLLLIVITDPTDHKQRRDIHQHEVQDGIVRRELVAEQSQKNLGVFGGSLFAADGGEGVRGQAEVGRVEGEVGRARGGESGRGMMGGGALIIGVDGGSSVSDAVDHHSTARSGHTPRCPLSLRPNPPSMRNPRAANLIQILIPTDHHRLLRTPQSQRLRKDTPQIPPRDPDDPCLNQIVHRIHQRTHDIQNRTEPQILAHGSGMPHPRVEIRREEEGVVRRGVDFV